MIEQHRGLVAELLAQLAVQAANSTNSASDRAALDQEVQQRISQIQNTLPTQLYPPVISKTNPEDQPILWVMLTADEGVPLFEQMMYARNPLKNQLSTLDGVGTVELAGYVDSNLRVWVDREKLYGYELMAGDVTNAIQTEQTEQPAGRIEAPKTERARRESAERKHAPEPGAARA